MWTKHRVGTAAAGAVVVAASTLLVGANSASADPGTCGVRVDQSFAGGIEIYTMRNKCASTHNFEVYLTTFAAYALRTGTDVKCSPVQAGQIANFWSPKVDRYWIIKAC